MFIEKYIRKTSSKSECIFSALTHSFSSKPQRSRYPLWRPFTVHYKISITELFEFENFRFYEIRKTLNSVEQWLLMLKRFLGQSN